MSNVQFRTVIGVELPGNVFVNCVVEESDEEVTVDHQVPEGVPPAATALALSQLLCAILPAGLAGFHAWKTYSALRANFEQINHQMANVPAISEDELPF